jgi:hypothetical protein
MTVTVDRRLRTGVVVTLLLGLAVVATGCLPGADTTRLHQQAQDALDKWTATVEAAGGPAVAPVGELTRQVGDWELEVGETNKLALMSGSVRARPDSLSDATPPDGEVRWQDGTSQVVRLLSAPEALNRIRIETAQPCQACVPLDITGGRLTTATWETTKGPAEVPVWEYTIAGTAVVIQRVALAQHVTVIPPPWDSSNPPSGLAIQSASASPDGRTLTVTFVGAPYPGDQPCGADYDSEAVESSTAVVVIVAARPHFYLGGCTAVGAYRTVEVALASPLGDRAVLEVQQGTPVPVVRLR